MRLLTLRTVLVATDHTSASDAALETARRLVEASGATLHVTHVNGRDTPSEARGHAPGPGFSLGRAGPTAGQQRYHMLNGDPAAQISALANRLKADLIVLGRHAEAGRDRPRQELGSTAYAVITTSAAPCLVVRHTLDLPLQRALVATDFSEAARGALLVALSWTSALRSRASNHEQPKLVALHVETDGSAARERSDQRTLDHELESLRRSAGGWAGVEVEGVTRTASDPARCIVDCAQQDAVELIVMGTRALQPTGDLVLGSVSDAVVREVDIPVLLVPPIVWHEFAHDLGEV